MLNSLSISWLVYWLFSVLFVTTYLAPKKPLELITKKLTYQKSNSGFSLVELIIALGIFSIIGFVGISSLIKGREINRQSSEYTQASLLAQEGIEAVNSIAKNDFDALVIGTYGLSTHSGSWQLSGTSDTYQQFSRSVSLEEVQRDSSSEIVNSGGSPDPETILATSQVSWNFNSIRIPLISYSKYFSNWSTITNDSSTCDWGNLAIIATYDKVGNNDANDVFYYEDNAYFTTQNQSGNDEEFFLMNVSTPENPILLGNVNLNDNLSSVFVEGNYAYLASDENNEELIIIDISSPSSPNVVSRLNLGGSEDANAIWVEDNYAYIAKQAGGGSDRELYIVNVSNPASPSISGTLEINDNVLDVTVSGDYAFLATSANSQELVIASTTNKSNPTISASLNIPGNADATTVIVIEDTLFLGRDNSSSPEVYAIEISNISSPTILGTYEIGSTVTELAYDNETLFATSGENNQELQLISTSNLNSLSSMTDINLGSDANGIAFNTSQCVVYTTNTSNSEELIILQSPQSSPIPSPTITPTPTPTPSPTSPPVSTCAEYCQSQSYGTGYCTPNQGWCNFFGGNYTPAGDVYCGGIFDNCCCE